MAGIDMAVFLDRAKETTTTTGTGDITLDGAATGYQALPVGGEDFYYCIVDTSTGAWEVGRGYVYGSTLVRSEVLDGSNGTSKVNFGAGTKEVFCTFPALMAGNVAAAVATTLPTGNAELATSDNTPTDITVTFAPLPPQSGGFLFLSVRYAVVASTPTDGKTKAWQGTLVYASGVGATDTPTVIHDPDTTGWAIAADISADQFVVTVTGHASNSTSWKITASVDCSQEIGA